MSSADKEFRKKIRERRITEPHTVYAMRCKENGKLYIGCTHDAEQRIRAHLSALKYNRHDCTSVRPDAEKYGIGGFEFYILGEFPDYETARNKEYEFIEKYKSNNPEYGYNIRHSRPASSIEQFMKTGAPPVMAQ